MPRCPAQLRARARLAVLQFARDHPAALREHGFVQPQFALAGVIAQRPWGRQCQHPAHILGGDKVDGVAQRPGADKLPVVDGLLHDGLRRPLSAQAQRPHGGQVVLGLHRAEMGHDLGRRAELRAGQALGQEAAMGNRGHQAVSRGLPSSRRINSSISAPRALAYPLSRPMTTKPHFCNTRREPALSAATRA